MQRHAMDEKGGLKNLLISGEERKYDIIAESAVCFEPLMYMPQKGQRNPA